MRPRSFLAPALASAALALAALPGIACKSDSAAVVADATSFGAGRRVRRLSAREYTLVVSDLLGESVPVGRFPRDNFDTGYDNGSANLMVQVDHADVYERVAGTLAIAAVAKHLDRVLDGCVADRDGEAACRAALFEGFAVRAFRRPLTPGEAERLGHLFDLATPQGGFLAGVEATVLALLQSPAFLYREELGGAADPSRPGVVELTAYERASELSFFLTGSMPDDALLAAARDGRIATPEDLRREGQRLLATPRAREQLRHLVDLWLATSRLASVPKDPVLYADYDDPLKKSLREELDRFYDKVLVDGPGTLAALFGSSDSFVDARLARHYGIPAAPGDGFAEVSLDPVTRSGILTRAGYLTVHSSYDTSNPIERGVFLRAAILCAPPRPPPPNIPRTVPKDDSRTTRGHFAEHTKDAFCQGCHAAIDGVGFGFEQFDAIGALRVQEHGNPVDTSGFLHDSDGADGPFSGASELGAKLLRSPRVPACFVRQIFRFAMGAGESEKDEPAIVALSRGFTIDTRIADLAIELVGLRLFSERWVSPGVSP